MGHLVIGLGGAGGRTSAFPHSGVVSHRTEADRCVWLAKGMHPTEVALSLRRWYEMKSLTPHGLVLRRVISLP